MAARGRPTDYREAYAEGARKLARLGATDEEVADFYKVDVRTVYRWKNAHPDFCQALKVGKEHADDRVERSLYHRAVGTTHEEVAVTKQAINGGEDELTKTVTTTKVALPDTTAAIFWLKNRKPEQWRDKVDVEATHEVAPFTGFEITEAKKPDATEPD